MPVSKRSVMKAKRAVAAIAIPRAPHTRSRGTQTSADASTVRIGGGASKIIRSIKTGFPDRMRIKLVYQSDTVSQVSTSGAAAFYQFTLNGLFDPNLSGGGQNILHILPTIGVRYCEVAIQ